MQRRRLTIRLRFLTRFLTRLLRRSLPRNAFTAALAGALSFAAAPQPLRAQTAVATPPALPASAAPASPSAGVWDLAPLFATDAAWDAERQALQAELPALRALRGDFGRSAASLRTALDRLSAFSQRWRRVAVYASANLSTDNRNPRNQERAALVRALAGEISAATAWQDTEVIALGAAKLDAWIAAEPGLKPHAVALRDTLRLARHRLPADTEAALAALTPVLNGATNTRTLLVNADIAWPTLAVDGKAEKLNDTGYTRLREHPDRAVRQQAFARFFGAYGQFENTLGTTLAARVEQGVINAKLRGHPSAVAASLAANDVPESVLRTLVAEANAGLPALHRYFKLRQRLLKLPDLAYHDIYPDLIPPPRKFTADDAAALTVAAVRPLGADYQARLQQALAQNTSHVYPADGKSSGAYQSGIYGMTPLVFLNHQGTFGSASTFAHEWGHGMHSIEAQRSQPFETAGYPLFLAEIASMHHEALLQAHMLATAKNRQERLFYLSEALERYRGGFYRQTMFAEFELQIHDAAERGEALTGKKMTQLYCGLLRKYHGADSGSGSKDAAAGGSGSKDAAVGSVMSIDPVVCSEWAFIPHFMRPFYVYQYATSIAAATQFADRILAGQPGAVDAYLGVLRAGGSQYPVPLLKAAGVDMTSPEPYRAVVRRMGALLDEMEALLGADS